MERKRLRGAVMEVLCNVNNFPVAAQIALLGRDMNPLIEKVVDAVEACIAEEKV